MARPGLTGFFTLVVFCSAADELFKAELKLEGLLDCVFADRAHLCIRVQGQSVYLDFDSSIHNLNITYTTKKGQKKTIHGYDDLPTKERKLITVHYPIRSKTNPKLGKNSTWTATPITDIKLEEPVGIAFKYDERWADDVESAEKASGLQCKPFVIEKYVHSEQARFEYTFEYKLGRSVEHGLSMSQGTQDQIEAALTEMETNTQRFTASLEKTSKSGFGFSLFTLLFGGKRSTVSVKSSVGRQVSKTSKNSFKSEDVKRFVADFKDQLKVKEEEKTSMKVVVAPNQTIGFQQLAVKCGHVILRGSQLRVECFGENCPDKSCDQEQEADAITNDELSELRKAARPVDVGAEDDEPADAGAQTGDSGDVAQFSAVLYMATICICIRHLLTWI